GGRNVTCQQWRHCVSDLVILLSPRAFEKVTIRERLQTRCFSHGKTAALCWIIVNVVVPVLTHMRGDRSGWFVRYLDAKAVTEHLPFQRDRYIGVSGMQFRRKIAQMRRPAEDFCEGGAE